MEINLSNIDRKCLDVSCEKLNDLRVCSHNHHKTNNKNSETLIGCVALDEMRDAINSWTKEMILNRESASWVLNSLHSLPGKKCVALIDGECRLQQLNYNGKESDI